MSFPKSQGPRRCLTKPTRGHSCLREHQHFFPTQESNQRKQGGYHGARSQIQRLSSILKAPGRSESAGEAPGPTRRAAQSLTPKAGDLPRAVDFRMESEGHGRPATEEDVRRSPSQMVRQEAMLGRLRASRVDGRRILVTLREKPFPPAEPATGRPWGEWDVPGSVCQGGRRMAFFRKVSSGW